MDSYANWRLIATGTGEEAIRYKLLEGYPKITYERENASAKA